MHQPVIITIGNLTHKSRIASLCLHEESNDADDTLW